jgi:hypothetical protein
MYYCTGRYVEGEFFVLLCFPCRIEQIRARFSRLFHYFFSLESLCKKYSSFCVPTSSNNSTAATRFRSCQIIIYFSRSFDLARGVPQNP